jgi:hypothetical protein
MIVTEKIKVCLHWLKKDHLTIDRNLLFEVSQDRKHYSNSHTALLGPLLNTKSHNQQDSDDNRSGCS